MLFMIAGYLKPGAEEQIINFRADLNEHFTEPSLVAGGVLRGHDGRRVGYMGFVQAVGVEEAQRFLDESPLFEEGLYERFEIFRYELEVGNVS
jgi:uncharacterized protein YciI